MARASGQISHFRLISGAAIRHNYGVKTMKRLAFSTLILLSATAASAQTPAPDTGYTATVRNSWNSVKRYVTASAEKMPRSTTPSSRPPRSAPSAS